MGQSNYHALLGGDANTLTTGRTAKTDDGPETPDGPPSNRSAVVGAVGTTVLARSLGKDEEEEEERADDTSDDGDAAKAKPSGVEFPPGLSARQKRLYLRSELKKALDAGDFGRCKTITELQEELDDRHERRLSRDGALRKADRENPYDKHLLDVYAEADVPWCVHKYSKAIRWDASALGLVGGVASILWNAAQSEGGVTLDLLRAQTKSMCWKIKERINGLGKEWVTDGNQIMRLDAEARAKRVPEEQWLRRHPLPGPEAWDDEFEADWQNWLAKSGLTAEGA